MSLMKGISRRQLLRLAAGVPLSGLAACSLGTAGRVSGNAFRVTLSGQALMEHSLCEDPYEGFDQVIMELQTGRFVFTDLEVAIRTPDSGEPTREPLFLHGAEPAVLGCLRRMGFNLLALSNNHAWDFGTAGILATRSEVIRAGFTCAGSGADIVEATAAGITLDRPRAALVAAATGKIRDGAAAGGTTAGINEIRMHSAGQLDTADVARNLAAITKARELADVVIAYLHNHHWGEGMTVTQPWAREYAYKCVDAGADIFVSHGAPLLHGIEIYRGKVLLHGLGSLVFHSRTGVGHYPAEVWESAIVHCDFDAGRLSGVQVVPVMLNETGDDPDRHLQTRGRPRLASGLPADRILTRLAGLSHDFGVALNINGSRALVENLP
jgi:poly-gamma-glutamate capsule biosynthesis protein CapA/YwtB (metallophosphatase superfamily)